MIDFLQRIKQQLLYLYRTTDFTFLLFLLLFLNIKLPLKLAAIIFIYASRFNFKFGIRLKNNQRIPVFYPVMAALGVLGALVSLNFSTGYLLLLTTICGIWLIAFLALHQVQLAIERSGAEEIHNALSIFFVINTLVSFGDLALAMLDAKSINPYSFEGLSYRYFTSTGDYIRGVLFDVCTANMIINAAGLFYFLHRRKYVLSLCCLLVILLTTSNLGNLIFLVFLLAIIIADKNQMRKSIALCCLSALVIFLVKVAPANLDYFKGSFKKLGQKLNTAPALAGIANAKHELNSDSLIMVYVNRKNATHQSEHVSKEASDRALLLTQLHNRKSSNHALEQPTDSAFDQQGKKDHHKILDYCKSLYGDSLHAEEVADMPPKKAPGKWVSFLETAHYLGSSPKHLLLGSGPGNFSSRFTFRALGLNTDGSWPRKYTWLSNDFKNNHLKLWLYYKIQPPAEHSITNYPNSVLNQLAGEYGLLGVAAFLIFYLWYFVKRYRLLSYGRFLLPMLMVFLLTDYWFENLSITVMFETLLLLDLHKKETIA